MPKPYTDRTAADAVARYDGAEQGRDAIAHLRARLEEKIAAAARLPKKDFMAGLLYGYQEAIDDVLAAVPLP